MRATIIPKAIILTKDDRAAVSIMAKCRVQPLICFLFLLPNYSNILDCFYLH